MFYKNKLKTKQLKYKLFNFEGFQNGINADIDDNIIPINQSKNSFNFSYKNGALSTGLGVKDVVINYNIENPSLTKTLSTPAGTQILALWSQGTYFSQLASVDRHLFAYCADGKVYFNTLHYNSSDFLPLINLLEMDEVPQFITYYINGDKMYLFITKNGGLIAYYAFLTRYKLIENAPAISSYCLHNNRMFVTDYNQPNRVWFSDEDDPTNWQLGDEQAGFIELHDERGNCLKVVSFEDYVYIFREFGITRISSFKNTSNITTQNMFVSGSRIIKDTICVCGDKIVFMTTDGLYSFNGNTCEKVNLKIDSWLKFVDKYSMAKFYNNAYYLTCKIDFNDNKVIGCEDELYTNNSLVKIDIDSNEVSILRGVDITYLNNIVDVGINFLVGIVKEKGEYKVGMIVENGKVFNDNSFKYWKSSPYDFGMPNKKKLIKNFYINSSENIKVVFNSDGKITEIDVKGSEKNICISPNVSGYKIGVEIMSETANCNISAPQILVGYL